MNRTIGGCGNCFHGNAVKHFKNFVGGLKEGVEFKRVVNPGFVRRDSNFS
jgi:hypothetical protein